MPSSSFKLLLVLGLPATASTTSSPIHFDPDNAPDDFNATEYFASLNESHTMHNDAYAVVRNVTTSDLVRDNVTGVFGSHKDVLAADMHRDAIDMASDAMEDLLNVSYAGDHITHPTDSVLYTNAVDARHNVEGMYLPPKSFNYSPARTRTCCETSCSNDAETEADCVKGCRLWLGSSSLNWETDAWHTQLRGKCDKDCAMSHASPEHTERIRTGRDPHSTDQIRPGNPGYKSYYETLNRTVDVVVDCESGCNKYMTCMYALQSTPVHALPNDMESRIGIDLETHPEGQQYTSHQPLAGEADYDQDEADAIRQANLEHMAYIVNASGFDDLAQHADVTRIAHTQTQADALHEAMARVTGAHLAAMNEQLAT
jgi:hypothetical protein